MAAAKDVIMEISRCSVSYIHGSRSYSGLVEGCYICFHRKAIVRISFIFQIAVHPESFHHGCAIVIKGRHNMRIIRLLTLPGAARLLEDMEEVPADLIVASGARILQLTCSCA